MALNTSTARATWQQLLEIDLGASKLRWADKNIALSDGTFWEARILSMSPLVQDAGELLNPRLVAPALRVVLADGDSVVRTALDANAGFAGKVVTVRVGQGTAAADYEVRFTGERRFPGGIEWTDRTVALEFDNRQVSDDLVLPKNKIFPTTYPNAEAKSKFLPIPEILGDFRSTAGGGEVVPCFCTDTAVGIGGQFTIAERCNEIEKVFKNGTLLTPVTDYTVNSFTPARFTLNVAYNPSTDTITANVLGRQSTLLTRDNPVDWAYTLLVDTPFMNIGVGNVVTANFTTLSRNYYGPGDLCRRWIGKEISARGLLAELAHEGFFDLVINASGQYDAVFRIASNPASSTVFREVDIKPDGQGGRLFRVLRDPERTYANQVVSDYALKPGRWDGTTLVIDEEYAKVVEAQDTVAQTAVGQTRRRRLHLKWHYGDNGAKDRTHRERMAYSNELEMADLTLGARAVTFKPTDQFQLIYRQYEITATLGTPFMVRSIEPDYQEIKAKVLAWNLDSLKPKRYQADGAPVWSGATAYDKEVMGFYADSNGEASPGNPDSGGQYYF